MFWLELVEFAYTGLEWARVGRDTTSRLARVDSSSGLRDGRTENYEGGQQEGGKGENLPQVNYSGQPESPAWYPEQGSRDDMMVDNDDERDRL